jgi:hypothetical protein
MAKISLLDRFMSKFEPVPWSGCWIWTAAVKEHGYGVIGLGGRQDGTIKAHRASYLLFNGEIPEGCVIMHTCNNPYCVNPKHLQAGTRKENQRYMVKCGRNKMPDNSGIKATWSKLSELNVKEIMAAKENKVVGVGTSLAKKFNVSKSTIYQIWSGSNWKHLQP